MNDKENENENINKNETPETDENESLAARRIKALGEDKQETETEEPVKINRLANIWYHYKVRIIIIAAFAFIISVAMAQYLSRSDPDVYILYAGPDYITANGNTEFCDVLESLIDDCNGDNKVYVQLNDMVFMTEDQANAYIEYCDETGEDMMLDMLSNKQMNERFTYEVFGGDASICIFSEDQYDSVAEADGFMKLETLFDEIPEGAIDEYGVRLSETKLYKFYDCARIFPEDAVIAIRKVSTMSAITGKKKAEKRHGWSEELFKAILNFEYPEGYVPTETVE